MKGNLSWHRIGCGNEYCDDTHYEAIVTYLGVKLTLRVNTSGYHYHKWSSYFTVNNLHVAIPTFWSDTEEGARENVRKAVNTFLDELKDHIYVLTNKGEL